MLKSQDSLNKDAIKAALSAVVSCAPEGAVLSLRTAPTGSMTDFEAEVLFFDKPAQLLIETTRAGQPREVDTAILRLRNALAHTPKKSVTIGVVTAPFIGEASAKLCKEAGVGYFDLVGNARFLGAGVFIERRVPANPFYVKREQRSLFSDKAARVARTVLSNPGRLWKVAALAEAAQVSAGHVSQVRKLLLDRQWAEVLDEGLRLTKPDALLDAWAEADDFSKRTRIEEYSTLTVDPEELAGKIHRYLETAGVKHAFTQWIAAAYRHPHTTVPLVSVYVEKSPEVADLCKSLLARPVDSGGRLRLIYPKDAGVFTPTQTAAGLPLVSDTQLYLDLLKAGLRGEEAARELRSAPDFRGPGA